MRTDKKIVLVLGVACLVGMLPFLSGIAVNTPMDPHTTGTMPPEVPPAGTTAPPAPGQAGITPLEVPPEMPERVEVAFMRAYRKLVGPAGQYAEPRGIPEARVPGLKLARNVSQQIAALRGLAAASAPALEPLAETLASAVLHKAGLRSHCSLRRQLMLRRLGPRADEILQARYASLRNKRVYFAALMYQCNDKAGDWVFRLLQAITSLGGSPEDVFVSIFSNKDGGYDDGTTEHLEVLREALGALGVPNAVVTDGPKQHDENRIGRLAKLREKAMEPLRELAAKGVTYDRVVFLNDVFYCSDDVLELLYQSFRNDADITCPVDYNWARDSNKAFFYDCWVARDVTGQRFKNSYVKHFYNFTEDTESNRWLDANQPFQVMCCWNGMAVINAAPLIEQSVKFRRGHGSECMASECSLLCKDFFALGYNRFVVVPSIHLYYEDGVRDAIENNEKAMETLYDSYKEEWPIKWINYGDPKARKGRDKVWCTGIRGTGHRPDTSPIMEQYTFGPSRHGF